MVHGPGGSLGAPALYNVEEELKQGTEIALTHDLPMVVETALEDLVKSVHVIHSHAQVNDSSKTCRTWILLILVMLQKETSLTEFILWRDAKLLLCQKIFFKTIQRQWKWATFHRVLCCGDVFFHFLQIFLILFTESLLECERSFVSQTCVS